MSYFSLMTACVRSKLIKIIYENNMLVKTDEVQKFWVNGVDGRTFQN